MVPDILANAGGVVVSYFAWIRNIQSLTWYEEEMNRTLEKIIISAFNEVCDEAGKSNRAWRKGAYKVAMRSNIKVKMIRGVFSLTR